MYKLNETEINKLQELKGTRGGSDRFFDMIEEIYSNDAETMADIHKCREMYYEYMDELLEKIGYHK